MQMRHSCSQLLIQLLRQARLAELLRHFAADSRLHEGCCEQVLGGEIYQVRTFRPSRYMGRFKGQMEAHHPFAEWRGLR